MLHLISRPNPVQRILGDEVYPFYQQLCEAINHGASEDEISVLAKPIWIAAMRHTRQDIKDILQDKKKLLETKDFPNKEEYLKEYDNLLAGLGYLLLNNLLIIGQNQKITDEELAEIFHVKPDTIINAKNLLEKLDCKPKNILIDLIFVHGIEPENDCPFWEAIFAALTAEIDRNPKLQRKMRRKMEEVFPEIASAKVIVQRDKYGRIVSARMKPRLIRGGLNDGKE